MKTIIKLTLAICTGMVTAHAATFHVAPDGNDASDGASWATAKQTIQAAVTAASDEGDTIIVTNGTYASIATDNKAVTIRSVNGPDATIINGGGTNRCATLLGKWGSSDTPALRDCSWESQDTATILTGFTLTNGWASEGGGAYGGTLNNCLLTGNSATAHGGAAAYGTLNNCRLTGNTSGWCGGAAHECKLISCLLTGNSATWYGGGAFRCRQGNCILTGNAAGHDAGGAYESSHVNCIVWGNTVSSGINSNYYDGIFSYSCTTPLPPGEENIARDPRFADAANGDFRLQENSPCVNAGLNLLAVGTTDVDGNPRIIDLAVDMGAYERGAQKLPPGYAAWLITHARPDTPRNHAKWQAGGAASPDNWYVNGDAGNDANDGATWATAKKTIQAAINEAYPHDTVIVTNGVYAPIFVDSRTITIQSVNGPQVTIIDGGGADRCATLGSCATRGYNTLRGGFIMARFPDGAYTNTVLAGFTLTNGLACDGGGVLFGTLDNCLLKGNTSTGVGGGAFHSTLNNCRLSGNNADQSGGGADDCILNNCTLSGNNTAGDGGGSYWGTLNNCLLTGNTAALNGGGSDGGKLNNCTLFGNKACSGGGSYSCTLNNCIVWGNTAHGSPNHCDSTFAYSCTSPLPSKGDGNNIVADPRFVDAANGDFRLQENSPCINAGWNLLNVSPADVDGNPRVIGITVDMGAYEWGAQGLPPDYVAWLISHALADMPRNLATWRAGAPGQPGNWYVSGDTGNDANDGASWETAKKTIQTAINEANLHDTVIVADGVYAPISTLEKTITIQSANGPKNTIIDGGRTNRCASLGAKYKSTDRKTTLNGFTLTNGHTTDYGGGVHGGILNNCILTGNSSRVGGGAASSTLNNCLLIRNTAQRDGGGSYSGTLSNCTLTWNSAEGKDGGAYHGTLNNCIVWGNTASDGTPNHYNCSFTCSCTDPLPTSGTGNIAADPLFADAANGDFRLREGSPCIDAGCDERVTGATDLDGSPRVIGTAVDMGAYEWLAP